NQNIVATAEPELQLNSQLQSDKLAGLKSPVAPQIDMKIGKQNSSAHQANLAAQPLQTTTPSLTPEVDNNPVDQEQLEVDLQPNPASKEQTPVYADGDDLFGGTERQIEIPSSENSNAVSKPAPATASPEQPLSQVLVTDANPPIANSNSAQVQQVVATQTQGSLAATASTGMVASAILETVSRNETRVEVQLDPPELGRVWVELRATDSRITASIVSEIDSTNHLLQENLSSLQKSLAESGVSVDNFSFDSGGGRTSRENASPFESTHSRIARDTPTSISAATARIARPTISNSRIDLIA
ncbi:MAG: flagellar hook-length control protein FliK, partial [Planctomycetales bacterium]|nr:flagellar hook-length control protein FliK [Planctomycetales bacterium]